MPLISAAHYYRKWVSKSTRDWIYESFLGYLLQFKRNFKISSKYLLIYCFRWILPKTKENELYGLMGRYGISTYIYPFRLKYKLSAIQVYFDEESRFYYVLHKNKKLYFPKSWDENRIRVSYNDLLIEQDCQSPHRYVDKFDDLKGKTILDIGAAEGIFSLDAIDYANFIYLFECETMWFEALRLTFAPYKEKTEIIPKYVSDRDDNENITLDTFMKEKNISDLFIKMDIEGAEQSALKGAELILNQPIAPLLAVCTYHRENDAEEIKRIFEEKKIKYEFNDGYMFYENCFRKVLVRTKKD